MPPRTGNGFDQRGKRSSKRGIALRFHRFGRECDQFAQLPRREFRQPRLAGTNDVFGYRPFSLDEFVDALLERSRADELVHLDVLGLSDAKRAIRGLVFDRRVPPAIEMKDVVGACEVEAEAAGFEGEYEERRSVVSLKPLDHLVARTLGNAAVQKQHLAPETFREAPHEQG